MRRLSKRHGCGLMADDIRKWLRGQPDYVHAACVWLAGVAFVYAVGLVGARLAGVI